MDYVKWARGVSLSFLRLLRKSAPALLGTFLFVETVMRGKREESLPVWTYRFFVSWCTRLIWRVKILPLMPLWFERTS